MPAIQQAETYLGNATDLISEAGEMDKPAMRDRMLVFLHAVGSWIKRAQARPLQPPAALTGCILCNLC